MKVKLRNGETKNYRAVWIENDYVKMIDQRKLPFQFDIYTAKDYREVADAIRTMTVRGAPTIGATAAYGIAQAIVHTANLDDACALLRNTRPTAHDLFYAIDYMLLGINNGEEPIALANRYADRIVAECKQIGIHGTNLIRDGYNILTHCNAGALAAVDYGTALAPIRMAQELRKKIFVYVDETRPRLQGAKLTAWELYNESIPYAIIADNAAGYFMKKGDIDIVITGADRIAANGDTANKIGTYEKAVVAYENGISFYVAAPMSTFDFSIANSDAIIIEERAEHELLYLDTHRIAPDHAHAKNPAFDITPAKYITAFITERGIIKPTELQKLSEYSVSTRKSCR
jgi:S-methyl-5-thioribose-1-phosphate isomerase